MADEQRRERKEFEPPPWEKEAFEAFHARRAEREAVARAEALATMAGVAAPATTAPDDLAAQLAEAMKAKAATDPENGQTEAAGEAAEPVAQDKGEVPDKLVEVLMLELAQEEASDTRSAKIVAWVASGVTGVLGLAMVVAGLVLAAKAQGQGSAVIGSAVLTVFGLIFAGMAAWVWISSNRVRGR